MSVNIIMQVLNSAGYEPMYPFNPAQCLNATVIDTSTASNYNISIVGVETPITADIGNSLGIISFIPNVGNAANATLSINGDTALPIRMADGSPIVAGVLKTTQPVFLKYYNAGFSLLVDKSSVGLNNVDNTSDLNKPISTATQNALDQKLNIPQLVPNNANLNTYQTAGMYYCATTASAKTMSNLPIQDAFSLLVEKSAGATQTFTTYNLTNATSGVRSWKRVYFNGTWSNWVQVGMVFYGTSNPANTLGQDGNIYIKYE